VAVERNQRRLDLALETCSTCPKLCRSRCPVARSEATEVAVPTFKMLVARETRAGRWPLEASAAGALYKCTSCVSSRSLCRHDVAVDDPLREGRERAVAAGVAPPQVAVAAQRFDRYGSLYSAPRGDVFEALRAEARPSQERQGFAPSCVSVARDRAELTASWRLLQSGGEATRPSLVDAGCCGYPLFELGLTEAFERAARASAAKLAGLERLIVTSPACAWTYRHVYPRLGLKLPEIVELSVALEGVGGARSAFSEAPSSERSVIYHDACFLGRRLGVYDAPRRLIAEITGRPPIELLESREFAPCAGGGGPYGWTHPGASRGIAERCLELAPEGRRDAILVSACPSARRRLREADPEQKIMGLAELAEAWGGDAGSEADAQP
jgi:dimethylglycine catabolism B